MSVDELPGKVCWLFFSFKQEILFHASYCWSFEHRTSHLQNMIMLLNGIVISTVLALLIGCIIFFFNEIGSILSSDCSLAVYLYSEKVWLDYAH